MLLLVTEPLFQLSNQSLGYGGSPVLKGLSLSIEAGEKVALIGTSGSGKTTLLRRLYSHQPQRCALVPQQLGLVPVLSVFHNIFMGRLHQHSGLYNLINLLSPRQQPIQQIQALATKLGLQDQLWRSAEQLSGGQQQRTALARALYRHCPIFIGDEPVSSVDEFQSESLLQLINQQHGTVVVALHDRELALNHFQRIIGLKQGKVVLDAPSDQLTTEQLAFIYQ
ncbi:MAG: phosphonate transport system ATP-binding protein [Motiliproteus sp.]